MVRLGGEYIPMRWGRMCILLWFRDVCALGRDYLWAWCVVSEPETPLMLGVFAM